MRYADRLSRQNELKRSALARRFCKFILLMVWICLSFSGGALAQTSDSQEGDSQKPWTATTESKEDYANPTRTIRTHTQSGNHAVDVRSIEARGPDGTFHPYQDIETETVRENATTVRTTTRTFVRDSNGAKTLSQVTEEDKQTFSGGDSKLVRTTSNPDANGNLQVVQRENQVTSRTSPDVEETKTTVMLPGVNGGLAPAMQMQERQQRRGNTTEIQKTTLLPDGAGSWQVGEVRHTTIKDDAKTSSREELVSRPDLEGNLSEISRTVSEESGDGSGDRQESESTYSIDVPGEARDNGLHLVQRVTTTQHTSSDGQQTTRLESQPDPGDPGAGLRATTVMTETVRLGPAGAKATETIQLRNANGDLGVVSVDMTKADSVQAIGVQIAPPKPK
jgi:hypothetical protein